MRVRTSLLSGPGRHEVVVSTNGHSRRIEIPPKREGQGSSVNGGELLLAALATCYCNDVYREAAKREIVVEAVEVTAEAEFEAEGKPASKVRYSARVRAKADEATILELLRHTDRVAEIHNTLRAAVAVELAAIEAVPAR